MDWYGSGGVALMQPYWGKSSNSQFDESGRTSRLARLSDHPFICGRLLANNLPQRIDASANAGLLLMLFNPAR